MWASLNLDLPSPKERWVLELTGVKEKKYNAPTGEQADSLRPLRDTGPSVPREKKVRMRHREIPLCPSWRLKFKTKLNSHYNRNLDTGDMNTALSIKEIDFSGREGLTLEKLSLHLAEIKVTI